MGQRIFDKAAFYVQKGRCDKLLLLLNEHSYPQQSPEACLVFHAIWDNREMLSWLLRNDVHPDSRLGPDGNTPLMQVAADNDLAAMRPLIEAGADVNARNEENETPLGFACAWSRWDAARLLLESGADVNAVEDGQSTYLDWAVDRAHSEGVELLRSYGGKQFSELRGELS